MLSSSNMPIPWHRQNGRGRGIGSGAVKTLPPAERHDDFLIASGQDNLTILDGFDGQLVGLSPELQSKLLSFLHYFSVDDGEAGVVIECDGADDESGREDIGTGVFRGSLRARHWFPADRPKWIAAARIHG